MVSIQGVLRELQPLSEPCRVWTAMLGFAESKMCMVLRHFIMVAHSSSCAYATGSHDCSIKVTI